VSSRWRELAARHFFMLPQPTRQARCVAGGPTLLLHSAQHATTHL